MFPEGHRHLSGEAGMTIVEVLVAAAILVGGLVAALSVFAGSSRNVTTSERKEIAVHQGERELERLRVIAFDQLALAGTPGAATDAHDPRAHVVAGTPPRYDWDWASADNATEPLVIASSPSAPDATPPRRTWSEGRFTGTTDVFITSVDARLKRVLVAVRLDGDQAPRRATVLSTLIAKPPGGAP
jgi:Tfp pilus assembly protein PilV